MIGIQALSAVVPETVRTNDYYRSRQPKLVEEASLARLFAKHEQTNLWDEAMAPYLGDPFRGTVERRVLGPEETALDLELRAARSALAAAKLSPSDIGVAIVSSFLPDQLGPGNAAFLAKELHLRCPAWNVESTCTSALVAMQTAFALVSSGQYANALVVTSCTYSRAIDERDTLGWFMGDAAGAFVIGPGTGGFLGFKFVSTNATCNTFFYDIHEGKPRIQCAPRTGRVLRDTSEGFVRESVDGAARAAGVQLSDIACFVFNSPTAWFTAFAARALDIDPARTISTYPHYGNVGPALLPVNLHAAATRGLVKPGELVMLYTIGSVSNAGASVVRWGDIALGS